MSEKYKLLIFDMDGLLVDSEPWWKVAEKKVFSQLGLALNDELLRQVMGFRLNEVVEHWFKYQPWAHPNFAQTENEIIEVMQDLLNENAVALPGVIDFLAFASKKNIPMALASSSSMRLIETVVDKLQIREYFNILRSAEVEKFGKPHPDIFIHTAQHFSVEASQCLVFEDSINGVIAAKAARMNCVAIPEKEKLNDPRFSIADFRFENILEAIPLFREF